MTVLLRGLGLDQNSFSSIAAFGLTVNPTDSVPDTVGDLGQYSIEAFYVVDYSNNQRKLTKAEYQFLKGVIRLRHADKLKARKDNVYYGRIEKAMNKAITKGIAAKPKPKPVAFKRRFVERTALTQ